MPTVFLAQPLTLAALRELLAGSEAVRLSAEADQQLAARHALVSAGPASGGPVGAAPATVPTPPAAGLLLAYAVGTGPELPAPLVRRLLLLHAYHLGRQPGVNPALVRRLLDFFNREVWPVVPEQGAAGLADNQIPLAHLALPLLGLGEVDYQGYRLAAADVLSLFSWEPLALRGPEGPALLGGSAFALAYATEALARTAHLLAAATAIGALAAAAYGAALPLPASSEISGQPEAATPAEASPTERLATTLSHANQAVEAMLRDEVAPAELLAMPAPPAASAAGSAATRLGQLAGAVAAVGEQAAAHVARLVAGGQPPRHQPAAGTAGFGLVALPQLAASLVAQNQQLCRPPASAGASGAAATAGAGAEDAASLRRVVEHTEQLLSLALLAAVQALERRPAPRHPALAAVVVAFRAVVTFVDYDRALAPDLHRAARFVREYAWA